MGRLVVLRAWFHLWRILLRHDLASLNYCDDLVDSPIASLKKEKLPLLVEAALSYSLDLIFLISTPPRSDRDALNRKGTLLDKQQAQKDQQDD